jgi:3-isopropylmalate dehydrogenase
MKNDATIVLLPGDGIGPEVLREAQRVLEAVAARRGRTLRFSTHLIGGIAIDETGTALPRDTEEACLSADAVLLGAVGGPKWSDPAAPVRPEQGLLAIRKAMNVYANLRPVRVFPALADRSPLRPEKLEGVDFVVVRELTGGLYFGEPRIRDTVDGVERAIDTLVYTAPEIERVVDLAFRLAAGRRKHVTSVDKANVLESSRLWRTVAERVRTRHAGIELAHQLVDSCAMLLLTHAKHFDVIVTENMFGDILTDEAAALAGSLGMLPSASIGDGTRGLYEPIHGSAPDIAGKGIANPIGAVLSAAMLLRLSLGWMDAADAVEQAVDRVIADGARTRDLGGDLSTDALGTRIVEALG